MNYLLDTHIILWYAQGSNELSQKARTIIEGERCYYSIASFWEIAIKQKLGKLDEAMTIYDLEDLCEHADFNQLPIISRYIENTKSLGFIHRDPFDRLLVSCAQCENLTIITCDSLISKYNVKTVW